MSKTQENLKTAFAGESQANRKYLAFAKKAMEEGRPGLAKLFRAAADGETVHAMNDLSTMGGIKTSAENLEAAIKGETYEVETMYPQFVAEAEAEGEKMAKTVFGGSLKVEAVHQRHYKEALEKITAGEDVSVKIYHVCQVCGNLFEGDVPDNCPVCQASKDKFLEIK